MWLYVPNLTSDYPSALEPEGSTSACTSQSQDTALWLTSSGKPTQRPLSWHGWKMRPWIALLSGTISRPSMADAGVDAWISSLRAIRVSRSRQRVNASARPMNATSGRTSAASSFRRGRSGSSLRTSAAISLSASTLSIESYRSLVSRLRHDFNRRQKLAQAMSESGCSSWPTPTSAQAKQGADPRQRRQGRTLVSEASMLWPTPSAALTNDREAPETFLARRDALSEKGINGNGAGIPLTIASKMWPTPEGIRDAKSPGTKALLARRQDESARGQPLVEVAAHWPTPTVGDAKSSGSRNTEDSNANFGVSLTDVALGSFGTGRSSRQDQQTETLGEASSSADQTSLPRSLNPSFVEWLMGWPQGWTDCASREMELSRWLQQQRIALSSLSWNFEPKPGAEPEPLQLELV